MNMKFFEESFSQCDEKRCGGSMLRGGQQLDIRQQVNDVDKLHHSHRANLQVSQQDASISSGKKVARRHTPLNVPKETPPETYNSNTGYATPAQWDAHTTTFETARNMRLDSNHTGGGDTATSSINHVLVPATGSTRNAEVGGVLSSTASAGADESVEECDVDAEMNRIFNEMAKKRNISEVCSMPLLSCRPTHTRQSTGDIGCVGDCQMRSTGSTDGSGINRINLTYVFFYIPLALCSFLPVVPIFMMRMMCYTTYVQWCVLCYYYWFSFGVRYADIVYIV